MTLHVPTSTQWISFPTSAQSVAQVSWTEGMAAKSASYYVTKCYWGNLGDEKDIKKKGVHAEKNGQTKIIAKPGVANQTIQHILGEARLFVAAEFIEKQYLDGPMKDFHIWNLAGRTKEEETNWITMQLNECFHYGQNGSGRSFNRFIVYHPPIAPNLRSPRMFQHRFTGLTSADFAKAASEELPELVPEGTLQAAAEIGGKLASYAVDLFKGVAGHYLHQYLGSEGIEQAAKLDIPWETVIKNEPSFSEKDKGIFKLQYVEVQRIEQDNLASKEDEKKREQMARETLDRLREMIQQKNDAMKKDSPIWNWFGFGNKSKHDSTKARNVSEAVVLGSQDADEDLLKRFKAMTGAVEGTAWAAAALIKPAKGGAKTELPQHASPAGDQSHRTDEATLEELDGEGAGKNTPADAKLPLKRKDNLHSSLLYNNVERKGSVGKKPNSKPSLRDQNVGQKEKLAELNDEGSLLRNLEELE